MILLGLLEILPREGFQVRNQVIGPQVELPSYTQIQGSRPPPPPPLSIWLADIGIPGWKKLNDIFILKCCRTEHRLKSLIFKSKRNV